ncbi:MAG: flagellar biosynthetic protein FliR [Pseudomonadota bacterium]
MIDVITQLVNQEVYSALLVFARLGAFMILMPSIGENYFSARFRLSVAILITILVTPIISPKLPGEPATLTGLVYMIGSELLIGLFYGTLVRILFFALATAGTMIGLITGFASSQLFNPSLAVTGPLQGIFFTMIGLALIMAGNFHHLMLKAVFASYDLIKAGEGLFIHDMALQVVKVSQDSFDVAFKLTAPFLLVMVVFYILMALSARLMPQLQVFFALLPLQIIVGIFLMAFLLSAMFTIFFDEFSILIKNLSGIIA